MKASDIDAKYYLIKNYILLFCGTTAVSLVLGGVISIFQMRSVHDLHLERLNKVIFLHKNELLNEVALEEFSSIRQHLDIIRGELAIDRISLQFNGLTFTSSDSKSQIPTFSVFVSEKLFFPLIGVRPLVVPVTNTFESINVMLNIEYGRNFSNWVLMPFLTVLFFIFIFALLSVGLIFFSLFRKIDKALLLPLKHVTESFQKSAGDGLVCVTEKALEEIKTLAVASEKLRQAERAMAFAELASQISHDIRSPLSALNMVTSSLTEMPEAKRLIVRNATQRINDIANGLLQKSKNIENSVISGAARDPVMLIALLDSIVSEKRTQFREKIDVEIEGNLVKGYGLFSNIDPAELSRVISNLINNSIEAFENGKGRVRVSIQASTDSAMIIIEDNGKGIPPHILTRLGEEGITHGKEGTQSGSGLGVSHARRTIEGAGGKFAISSSVGKGTKATLTLPKCDSPNWFVERILICPNQIVVSVDDDQSIHQIWAGRFASSLAIESFPRHVKFTSLDEFEGWVKANRCTSDRYLIDYEFLGQDGNGLEIIERLQIQAQSILVSSRYEEPQIQIAAQKLKLKILPKNLAHIVPIETENSRKKYDAVLIDDDVLVHMAWKMAASEKNMCILCFTKPEEFFSQVERITVDTPIYTDVSLADDMRGDAVADFAISKGFKFVYLATGYESNELIKQEGLSGVVGKDFPFC